MEKKKFIICVITVLLCTVCLWNGASVTAADKETLGMQVEYGYDNCAKLCRYMPVTVKIDNPSGDYNGYVRILVPDKTEEYYEFSEKVNVAAGESMEVSMQVPVFVSGSLLRVSLMDSEGKEILYQNIKPTVSNYAAQIYIGVLTEDYDNLSYFNDIDIKNEYSEIRGKTFRLRASDIEKGVKALDMFDVIVVSDYDVKELQQEEIEVLKEWVDYGGILLSGIRNAEDAKMLEEMTSARLFQDLYETVMLPATIEEMEEINFFSDEATLIDSYFIYNENMEVLLESDGFFVAQSCDRGKGKIAIFGFSFGDEVFSHWHGRNAELLSEILAKLFGKNKLEQISMSSYNYIDSMNYWEILSALENVNIRKNPDFILYIAVFVLYVLVIGPGIYLFLKKKGKREYMAVCVCLFAVLFSGIIFVMSRNTRITEPFINYVTMLNLDGGTAREETFYCFRAPYNGRYNMTIAEDYYIMPVLKEPEGSFYYSDTEENLVHPDKKGANLVLWQEEEFWNVTVNNMPSFEEQYFHLMKNEDTEQEIEIEVSLFDGKPEGRVTNRSAYRLENSAVFTYGAAIFVGELDVGETKDLSECRVVPFDNYITYDVILDVIGVRKAGNGGKRVFYSSDENQKISIFSQFLSNYIDKDSGTAYFVGISSDEKKEGFLENILYESYGKTLISTPVEINYDRGDCRYILDISDHMEVYEGDLNQEYGIMYSPSLSTEYYFAEGMDVEKLYLYYRDSTGETVKFNGKMYFYNYLTDRYESIESDKKEFTKEEIEPYITKYVLNGKEYNRLAVKYESDASDAYGEVIIPRISATGRNSYDRD